jgi:hypothetical protein
MSVITIAISGNKNASVPEKYTPAKSEIAVIGTKLGM